MSLKMFLNNFLKKEIVGVQGPVKRHALVHGELKYIGYDVFVCMRDKKGRDSTKVLHFSDDNEALFSQYAGPKDAAQKYADNVRAKIEKDALERFKRQNTIVQIHRNADKARRNTK